MLASLSAAPRPTSVFTTLAVLAGSLAIGATAAAPALAADANCPAASAGLSGAGTSSGDPYLIQSQGDLQLVKANTAYRSGYFRQTQNIDMQVTPGTDCVWDAGINSTFSGTYDGGGYEISGLNIISSQQHLGLFQIVTGTVKNLGFTGDVTNTATTSWHTTGALVGNLSGASSAGIVENSYATGDVINPTTESNSSGAGGLVGYARQGARITGSYATGSVTADNTAGGLLGRSEATSPNVEISQSYATGNVEVVTQSGGGLVGFLYSATVSESYATGDITANTGTRYHFAGFAGASANSSITDSYSTGGVAGGVNQVGGFIGDYAAVGTNLLRRTFSVTLSGFSPNAGATEVGGYVGYGYPAGSNTATTSFWNYETSGYTSSDSGTGSGTSTGVLGRSTAELKELTTFTDGTVGVDWNTGGASTIADGYDPSYTWGMCSAVNDGYPFLTAFYSTDPCSNPPSPSAGDYLRPTATFHFRLPDGTECAAISPQLVYAYTTYILPGENAPCRPPGSQLLGWSVSHQDWDFAPGATVYVIESQVFTAVLRQPTIAVTWDANVALGDTCLTDSANPDSNASFPERRIVTYLDRPDMPEYSSGFRPSLTEFTAPTIAACAPPGLELTGWTIATAEGSEEVLPGAPISAALALASPNGGISNFTFQAKWDRLKIHKTIVRAAFFQGGRDQLTENGQQHVRELLAALPDGATNVEIEILGVSNSLNSTRANDLLASRRAEILQRELELGGLQGDFLISIDQQSITPATSSTGKILTTVRITYLT